MRNDSKGNWVLFVEKTGDSNWLNKTLYNCKSDIFLTECFSVSWNDYSRHISASGTAVNAGYENVFLLNSKSFFFLMLCLFLSPLYWSVLMWGCFQKPKLEIFDFAIKMWHLNRIAGVKHSYHLTNVKTICLKGPLAHLLCLFLSLKMLEMFSFGPLRNKGMQVVRKYLCITLHVLKIVSHGFFVKWKIFIKDQQIKL